MASTSSCPPTAARRSYSQILSSRRPFAVFVAAHLWFSFLVSERPLGAGYVDPVGRISAQDEAVYSHTALRMASRGDWLTPRFLERYALYKPPLSYWLSALSVKFFGRSPFSVRLPSVLAGAFMVAIAFVVAASAWGETAGFATAILLASNHLFYSLSRMNLTDALLCACLTVCAALLAFDPLFQRRRTAVLYGLAWGLAVMTKGLAGLLPVILLAAWLIVQRRRVPTGRLVELALIAFVVAAPWHLYQWRTHPRWFLAEYVQLEILGYGFGAPPQTSEENWWRFYGVRFPLLDPVLMAFAIASVPLVRKHYVARVLAVWFGVVAAALVAFRYRNASYLLPLYPAMAIAAGSVFARAPKLLPLLAVVVIAKLGLAAQPYGIAPAETGKPPSVLALDRYVRTQRNRELILVFADDDFYATTVGLRTIRYAFWAPSGEFGPYILPFKEIGVATTVDRFVAGDRTSDRSWGLDAPEALHTAILVRDPSELRELFERSPQRDFYVERKFAENVTSHDVFEAKEGWVYLLARRHDDSPVPPPSPALGSSESPR